MIQITKINYGNISLSSPVKIPDSWGIGFEVDNFKIKDLTKSCKCANVLYRKGKIPYLTKRKKLVFSDGKVTISVDSVSYIVGEYKKI